MRGKLLTVAAIVAALAVGLIGGTIARNLANPTPALAAQTVGSAGSVPPPIKDPTATRPSTPATTAPCALNSAAQRVVVSLAEQHMWLCAHGATVYDTAVTTGARGKATPTGQFHVEQKLRDQILNPQTDEFYPVKYWIAWDAPEYGFHDSSWQKIPYGSPEYATGGSHGCVHVPPAGIKVLWNWVRVGAAVTIA